MDDRVYEALSNASARIGAAHRETYMKQIRRDRRGRVTRGYTLAPEHTRVVETLDAYCRGRLTDEEAMCVLHEYDVLRARTAH